MNSILARRDELSATKPALAAQSGPISFILDTGLLPSSRLFRRSARRRAWSSQSVDQPQDAPEQVARHGDLCHLEGDITAMGNDLRPDLDQLLPDGGQRPVLHLLGQRQGPHEIGQIVGRGVKLEPDGVVAELVA